MRTTLFLLEGHEVIDKMLKHLDLDEVSQARNRLSDVTRPTRDEPQTHAWAR
ncbi:MAG: hypothetical protein HOM44_12995 [Gammaproteobacteria bacterium]|nr:hypothetical protein [Gammaproteobacteria bacterium]MBT5154995.1 hypothetical protein [Gammaproteobacteria bacterium]